MVPNFLSAIWAAVAPAVGNHLWQSTLCVVMAGLLTLALRKNHARARYGLWLAASIKFLVPFSLLIALGSHLARPRIVPQADTGFFAAMEQVSQPFTPPAAPEITPPAPSKNAVSLLHLLPAILLAVWLCGFLGVVFLWYGRWRRIRKVLLWAEALREGREVEALRRLERAAGIRNPIEVLSSAATTEPSVFGIVKPVLMWPRGISKKLQDAQLEAIIAHEVWHVRRRDNLAASVHMVVEAIFWFHPMVWWLGSRLVEERERACDEEVLGLGFEPQVYAEGIIHVCKYYLESPLVCVAGVSGSNLKKRMERIMNNRTPRKLDFWRKLMLATVGVILFAIMIACNYQFRDEFNGKLKPGWQWIDLRGDSSMSLDARPGFLRITVSGYHDLWPANRNYNAPRLMRKMAGDFTIETKMAGPSRWCGGLLVWKDQNNYVRFERAIHFRNELSFESANNGEFKSMARDYAAGDPTWLRLTRRGPTITATYSFNGTEWLPLKRLWPLFGFKKQPPEVEDGRSMLAEGDFIFEPGVSSTEMTATDPLLVGVSGIVPAIAPPIGLKQTVTDYDYVAITTP